MSSPTQEEPAAAAVQLIAIEDKCLYVRSSKLKHLDPKLPLNISQALSCSTPTATTLASASISCLPLHLALLSISFSSLQVTLFSIHLSFSLFKLDAVQKHLARPLYL